jgi:ABC-2 type transport system permease protein
MKRIIAIVKRDLASSFRDWLLVYISLAPFIIALILRFVIPSVGENLLSVVILENDPLATQIATFAKVEKVPNLVALEERVTRMDDVYGIVPYHNDNSKLNSSNQSSYTIISQGNEGPTGKMLLNALLKRALNPTESLPLLLSFTSLQNPMSPIKLYGATLLFLFCTVFGGMFIMLNIVDEKMHRTLPALNVAPITRFELIAGKTIPGFLLSVLGSMGAALIMDFGDISYTQLALTTFSIACISVIIGFSIGVMNDEPISAIASMKMVFLPIMISIFGALIIPTSWHWTLWWSPFFWAFQSIRGILQNNTDWFIIIRNSSIIAFLTLFVFFLLRKRIRNGLNG